MFPQLIAGPIVQYKTVAADLVHRVHTSENFALGARRFCVGLAKKVLLANSIGALWEECLAAQGAGTLTVLGGWLGLAAYGFQIYFDFSGYSDMAIGLGRMLRLPASTRTSTTPICADSVGTFWRRWHMSLTTWFRDYLYIPLGGNRGGTVKTIRNLIIVWFCTGFWHGASWNFVLWGLYFAAWLILERYVLRGVLEKTPTGPQAPLHAHRGVRGLGPLRHGRICPCAGTTWPPASAAGPCGALLTASGCGAMP